MTDKEISKIIDDVTYIMPVFFKKMFRVQNEILCNKEVSKPHLEVLFSLKREGMSTMSSLGKALVVSKPNITVYVGRLIELNLVERVFDKNDRRIIYIQLTGHGNAFIENYKENYKKYIKEKLVKFDDEDFMLLQSIMDNMKILLSKVNPKDVK